MSTNTLEQMVSDYNEGLSIAEVAKKHNRSPSTIQRLFRKSGVKTRSLSEAQKIALASGRASNPTEGKGHTESSKILMSEKMAHHWAQKSEADRASFKEKAKQKWAKLTDEQKREMLRKAGQALRQASEHGSEIEQAVEKSLLSSGYNVAKHIKDFMNGGYEIDLFVKELGVAIELDGPHHFSPIFGEQRLAKTMMFDMAKNGALIGMGITVLRVKCDFKNLTEKMKRDISAVIVETLKKIESGEITNKLVEVDPNA